MVSVKKKKKMEQFVSQLQSGHQAVSLFFFLIILFAHSFTHSAFFSPSAY